MECLMWTLLCECYSTSTHWMHDQEVPCFWCCKVIWCLRVVFAYHSEGQNPSIVLWLEGIGWDDCVPNTILKEWSKWRGELPLLSAHYIAQCYYPKEAVIVSTQLHGFSDTSERAYSGVVSLRMEDSNGMIYTSLVMSKTRVLIKRITIPRLDLILA